MTTQPSFFNGWTEPESAANTAYPPQAPYNRVTATESGHSFEMDDSPGRERVRLQHRTGTFIEMHPNGDEVHKVYGDGFEITIKNKNVLIEGNCNMTVNGNLNLNVKGDKVEYIEGNHEVHVKKNYTQVVEGMSTITSQNDMTIRGGASATGSVSITAGDCLFLNSDLSVDGEIVANKITSQGRIDALTGISAGPLGFVSVTGGLSIGVPVAVPGNIIVSGLINAAGTINSASAVNAPSGNFGTMMAVWMTDTVNTSIYDTHFHIVPLGASSPPISPMM